MRRPASAVAAQSGGRIELLDARYASAKKEWVEGFAPVYVSWYGEARWYPHCAVGGSSQEGGHSGGVGSPGAQEANVGAPVEDRRPKQALVKQRRLNARPAWPGLPARDN